MPPSSNKQSIPLSSRLISLSLMIRVSTGFLLVSYRYHYSYEIKFETCRPSWFASFIRFVAACVVIAVVIRFSFSR